MKLTEDQSQKYRSVESAFLNRYPKGFSHPDLVALGKKHKMEKMVETVRELFAKEQFAKPEAVAESIGVVIGRSSLVSLFEKAKFRDYIKALTEKQKCKLAEALKERLYGSQEEGFHQLVEILAEEKLAKWPIITAIPLYLNPEKEVLVKPTTAKQALRYFSVETLIYKPQPTYSFYSGYRDFILSLKEVADQATAPDNAAFQGAIMVGIELLGEQP